MAVNIVYTQNNGPDVPKPLQFASGRITLDATAIVAADYLVQQLGFIPKMIFVENVTDRTSVQWHAGMAQDTCIKTVAAGTRTLETTNKGLSVCRSDGTQDANGSYFQISQNATLAAILASKVLNWYAIG